MRGTLPSFRRVRLIWLIVQMITVIWLGTIIWYFTYPPLPLFIEDPPGQLDLSRSFNSPYIKYIITPDNPCTSKAPELIVCVTSATKNSHRRKAVRDTWGSRARHSFSTMALVFVLGNDPDNHRIKYEAKDHRDIVQADVADNFQNTRFKTATALHWVGHFCPKADFVLKAEDDVYINIQLLMLLLREARKKNNYWPFILGHIVWGEKPVREIGHKWYISEEEYVYKTLPKFALGTAYAMSSSAVIPLYNASRVLQHIWLEDVFFTGFCAREANISVIHDNRFQVNVSDHWGIGCPIRTAVSSHGLRPAQLYQADVELYDERVQCYSDFAVGALITAAAVSTLLSCLYFCTTMPADV